MLDLQSKVIKKFIASSLLVIKQQFKVFFSLIKPSFETIQKKKIPLSSLKTSNTQIKKNNMKVLHSSNMQEAVDPIDHSSAEFMYPDSICVIVADASSQDLVWFLKTDEIKELIEDSVDDYGHHVASGSPVMKGRYIERASEKSNRINYRIMKKNAYVFKESVGYPFMNVEIRKKFNFIRNNDYFDILSYVEHFGMFAL